MKKALALGLLVSAFSLLSYAQTTYQQTTNNCKIQSCTNATLSDSEVFSYTNTQTQYLNVTPQAAGGTFTFRTDVGVSWSGTYYYVRPLASPCAEYEMEGSTTDGFYQFAEFFKICSGARGSISQYPLAGGSLTVVNGS
jgi:hypothetical protein